MEEVYKQVISQLSQENLNLKIALTRLGMELDKAHTEINQLKGEDDAESTDETTNL